MFSINNINMVITIIIFYTSQVKKKIIFFDKQLSNSVHIFCKIRVICKKNKHKTR